MPIKTHVFLCEHIHMFFLLSSIKCSKAWDQQFHSALFIISTISTNCMSPSAPSHKTLHLIAALNLFFSFFFVLPQLTVVGLLFLRYVDKIRVICYAKFVNTHIQLHGIRNCILIRKL